MGRRKIYYLVVDTETANDISQPLPYDIGYAICDRLGNIVCQRSFIVADVFLDLSEAMKSAYFAQKIPQYWEDCKQGLRTMKTAYNIRKIMLQDMKKYRVKRVAAYNMLFDKKALNNLIRYTTQSRFRFWFPYDVEYCCIWNMACQLVLDTQAYIDFARKYGLESENGNLLTNAECCYKFITKQPNFEEKHTGLEDVLIEVDILAKCLSMHKKVNRKVNPACWQIPQKRFKRTIKKELIKVG